MVKFKRDVDKGTLYSVQLKENSTTNTLVLGVSNGLYYIKDETIGSIISESSSFTDVADLVSVANSIK